jgi:hypothetical protein
MLKAASAVGVDNVPSFARDASQQAISLISSSEQDKIKQQRALQRAGIRSGGGSTGSSLSSTSSSFSTPKQPQSSNNKVLALPPSTSSSSNDDTSEFNTPQLAAENRIIALKATTTTPPSSSSSYRSSFNNAVAKVTNATPSAFRNFKNQNQKKSTSGGGGMKSGGLGGLFGRGTRRYNLKYICIRDALSQHIHQNIFSL